MEERERERADFPFTLRPGRQGGGEGWGVFSLLSFFLSLFRLSPGPDHRHQRDSFEHTPPLFLSHFFSLFELTGEKRKKDPLCPWEG